MWRCWRLDGVGIFRIDPYHCEVVTATGDAFLGVDALPGCAGVVGAVERVGFAPRPARTCGGDRGRDSDADSAEALGDGGESSGELLPGVAAVGGFEKTAAGARPRAILPRALSRGPQHGVDGARVGGIEGEVDRAGVLVFVEHLCQVSPPSVERKTPRSGFGP